MGAETLPPPMSVEDYLAFDRASEVKHEYIDGTPYAMAGGTTMHGHLAVRAAGLLNSALAGTPCRVYSSAVRVQVAASRFFYPDVSVSCESSDLGAGDILRFPRIVIEVLSDSTGGFDRRDKFIFYQGCPSLQEYVLISQDEALVEVYRRTARGWAYQGHRGGTSVRLELVGAAFSLSQLYGDTGLLQG